MGLEPAHAHNGSRREERCLPPIRLQEHSGLRSVKEINSPPSAMASQEPHRLPVRSCVAVFLEVIPRAALRRPTQ